MTRADRRDFLLCALILAFSAAAVALAFVAQGRKAPSRPKISDHSTYAEIVGNFTGRPYSTGSFVSGYRCAGYTAGKDGHGWVVIRCRK